MVGELNIVQRGYPNTLCILFSDTKGIQWVDTNATHVVVYVYEGHPCV